MSVLTFPGAAAGAPADAATTAPGVVPAPVDAAARAAALQVDQSFIVEAPAGSGKTGLLVNRMLLLLCTVERPESVLALTFTNKATAEMRERVLKALDLASADPETLSDFDRATRATAARLLAHDRARNWNLQANSHRLNIRTIDSLCGEIARLLPLSSGSVGQMEPAENARPLYQRAARSVLLRLGGESAVLNDALRTVLLHRDADLHDCEALLADMLETREQWGRLVPLTVEELTDAYLDAAVRPRLDRTLESIVCGQLHRLEEAFPADHLHELADLAAQLAAADGYKELSNPIARCATFRRAPGSEAADAEHWTLLAHILLSSSKPFAWRSSLNVNHLGFVTTKPQKQRLKNLLEALRDRDDLYEQLLALRNLPPARMPDADWHVAKALFHLLHFALLELQVIFRGGNVCDFTERSIAARSALVSPETDIAADLGLEHLLVDEMQDTSSSQYELLTALTRGWDGTSRTVFLVGDPKQSIYLFRQARVERFLSSLQTGLLGTVPLTALRLTTNFRSAAPLVHQFNELFGPVFAAPASGGIPYTPADAARVQVAGKLCWHTDPLWGEYGKDTRRDSRRQVRREQAEHAVRTIHTLRQNAGAAPPSIAVLVRSREHAARITERLKHAGIPFRGVNLESLDDRPEVLDTVALTRALLHPADRVAWLAVLRAPWCGATLAELHQLADGEERGGRWRAPRFIFRERAKALAPAARDRVLRTLDTLDGAVDALGRMPLAELVERTSRALGTDSFRTAAERTNVDRFLELLEAMEAELEPIDAEDLQLRLSSLYAEPDSTPNAVDVMTIHKAKGLEWDVVFVPELQRSTTSNSQRLLDWLELPSGSGSNADVLLAPIAPRGYHAAELGCYVRSARKRQEEAEIARLLYVVVTRARYELHLYAAPELKQASGEVTRKPATLLATAWPGAGEHVQRQADERNAAHSGSVALLGASAAESTDSVPNLADRRRVPDGFQPTAWLVTARPAWHNSQASAAATETLEVVSRAVGGLSSRALGNAVHLFLDHLSVWLATHGTASREAAAAEIAGWTPRIRSVLRNAGSYGKSLERHTESVLLALRNTIGSPDGFWLLQPHAGAANEQLLPADRSDAAADLRMDRSFLAGSPPRSTGSDVLWIVDYKTATPGDLPLAEFLRQERGRYAPQLRNYARRCAAQYGTATAIMLALYYPLVPVLDAWPWEPQTSAAPQP